MLRVGKGFFLCITEIQQNLLIRVVQRNIALKLETRTKCVSFPRFNF